jgi:hypothetical protein
MNYYCNKFYNKIVYYSIFQGMNNCKLFIKINGVTHIMDDTKEFST